jgi:hypothetical protein
MSSAEFNLSNRVMNFSAFAAGRSAFNRRESYNSVGKFFSLWDVSQKNLWYLDRHGKLVGFSGFTRLPIGEIVAQGSAGPEEFIRSESWGNFQYYNGYNFHPRVLGTVSTVYRVQLDDRTLTPILAASPGETPSSATVRTTVQVNL